ncbi:MAG: lipopolysaccharide heptosyltransferase I [Halioglobus sp.]
MRVLIVKMSSLGDVIHTLPALNDAVAAIPGIRFDWVVEEAFAEIPAWHPAVDRVFPIALRRWRKKPMKNFRGPEWKKFRTSIGRRQYDLVIDAQGLLKSAMVARLVNAPRYGMDKRSVREQLASLFYHHAIAVPKKLHAVERTRMLFAQSLNYPIPTSQGDYGVRSNLKYGSDKLPASLLFFHGTARAEKLWPVDHWIELARLLEAKNFKLWLPWGSEKERQRADHIAGSVNNAEVLPKLNLLGLASMLMEVDGVVAVDTGLAHLSAALDVPTVSLYGPTDIDLIGAYGHNQVHVASPVSVADTTDPEVMMESIRAQEVCSALLELLSEQK